MANGTSSMRASVRASRVLPEPVGPISRMLLFSISTSACVRAIGCPPRRRVRPGGCACSGCEPRRRGSSWHGPGRCKTGRADALISARLGDLELRGGALSVLACGAPCRARFCTPARNCRRCKPRALDQLRTSAWDLPQKLQRVIWLLRAMVWGSRGLQLAAAFPEVPAPRGSAMARSWFPRARGFPCGTSPPRRPGRSLGLLGGHEIVAVAVLFDLLDGLPAVLARMSSGGLEPEHVAWRGCSTSLAWPCGAAPPGGS
jgi:hypothetical protein